MRLPLLIGLFWILAVTGWIFLFQRHRRRRGRIGAAASGSVYDLLNEDKRRAVEIIVEQKAEARDPEDRDGNLPNLAGGQR